MSEATAYPGKLHHAAQEANGDDRKHLFPAPRTGRAEGDAFANNADYVSMRHHTYEMPRGAKSVALTEVGPRFEMKLYQIKLGTIEADDADVEWALRPFMRSGKKRRL